MQVNAHGHGAVVMNGGRTIDAYAGRDLKASPGPYDKLTATVTVIEIEVAIDYQGAAYDQSGVLPQV
jgi:hypothetical protein